MNEWELTDMESYNAEGEGFKEWVCHGEPPHMKYTMERRAVARAAVEKAFRVLTDTSKAKRVREIRTDEAVLLALSLLGGLQSDSA